MSSWHLEFCNGWEYIESGTFGSNTKSDVQIASKRVLSMKAKRTNWSLRAGFLLSVVAAVSYFLGIPAMANSNSIESRTGVPVKANSRRSEATLAG